MNDSKKSPQPSLIGAILGHSHRRRLVINIGGEISGKYIFRQHYKKYFKNLLLFSKISEDLFLVIDNFFQKFTPFIQNVLHFLSIFLFLCLCFCFLSFFWLKK